MMNNDDDIKLHAYQDDLDNDDDAVDPLMAEEGDDPTETLGVSPYELGNELDKEDGEDEESLIEAIDEDGDDDTK
jgi:hypothetical protein